MKSMRVVIACMLAFLLSTSGGRGELLGMARADQITPAAAGVKTRAANIAVNYDESLLTVYVLTNPLQTGGKVEANTELVVAPKDPNKVFATLQVNGSDESGFEDKPWHKVTVFGEYAAKGATIVATVKDRPSGAAASVELEFDGAALRILVNNVEKKSGDKVYAGDGVLLVPKDGGVFTSLKIGRDEKNDANFQPSYWYEVEDNAPSKLKIVAELKASAPPAEVPVQVFFDDKVVKVTCTNSRKEENAVAHRGYILKGDKLKIELVEADKLFATLVVEERVQQVEGKKECTYERVEGDKRQQVDIQAVVGVPLTLSTGLVTLVNNTKITKVAANGYVQVIAPEDGAKVFTTLKINGKEVEGVKGKPAYSYEVPKDAAKVEVEATLEDSPNKGKTADIALNYDANVVNVSANAQLKRSGEKVFAGDLLLITVKDAYKAFTAMKINGEAVADIRGKDRYQLEPKAGVSGVKIEANAEYWVQQRIKKGILHGVVRIHWNDASGDTLRRGVLVLPGDKLFIQGVPDEGYELGFIEVNDKQNRRDTTLVMERKDIVVYASFNAKKAPQPDQNEETAVESELLAGASVVGNPVGSVLVLEGVESAERVEVYSVTGAQVLAQELRGERRVEVPTRGWASGVYVVRILARDGERTLRVVKK